MPHLPPALIETVKQQSGVLFLGSGASLGALHPQSKSIPTARALRDLISDAFLGGAIKDKGLSTVAEIAANESSLPEVQAFVSNLFDAFQPNKHHLLVPQFRWRSLVTTNYDLIMERAFEAVDGSQNPVVFIKDTDSFDKNLRAQTDSLELIKLHGSIDCPNDDQAPFILGTEQYAKFNKNRIRLYSRLKDLFYEYPVLFCGYSVEDPHIQSMIFSFTDENIARPMYYSVIPSATDLEIRYWAKHRVSIIPATFEEFMNDLDKNISNQARSIPVTLGGGTSSLRGFYVKHNVTEAASFLLTLEKDLVHVRSGMPVTGQDPKRFYMGYDDGWGAISQNLDAVRRVTDSILVDCVLAEETADRGAELFIARGSAGQGKTVTLKRVAWEAAYSYGKLVLYHRTNGAINKEFFEELHSITQQRIYLIVDKLSLMREEVENLIRSAKKTGLKITVIGAVRNNEWETHCENLKPFVTQDFQFLRLSEKEAVNLLNLLEKNDALGLLELIPEDQRLDQFMRRADRQLLVALHEATLGKPFEQIIYDEYAEIDSGEARDIYFKICCLHQFGAPVRAGLIHRVTGVSFSEFQTRLINPLKDVVYVGQDSYSGDHTYRARHEHVAELVFLTVTKSEKERFYALVDLISEMNTSYSSDKETFIRLIRGRSLSKMFSDVNLGRDLFERAMESDPSNPFVLQQKAIFEIQHPRGSLDLAETAANEAASLAPRSRSIAHTQAEIDRRLAKAAKTGPEKFALRKAARQKLNLGGSSSEYDFQTAIRLCLDEISELQKSNNGKLNEREVVDLCERAESLLYRATQEYPNSEHLRVIEAEYFDAIKESEEALKILQKAFGLNPRLEWIAIRLARKLNSDGRLPEAIEVLRKCLSTNPRAKSANLHLGHCLSQTGAPSSTVLDHYRLSFTDGDNNFDSQFWYARQAFIQGQTDISNEMFDDLHSRAPSTFRLYPTAEISERQSGTRRFDGKVVRKGDEYAVLHVQEFSQDVLANASDSEPDSWVEIGTRANVTCGIAFNRKGPRAIGLHKK